MSRVHTPEMFPHYLGAGRPRESSDAGSNWSDFDAVIRGLNGKRSGSTAMALCPAHDDRSPSLAIKLDGGKLLVHCHAGCSQSDVIAALKARGLWTAESITEDRAKKDRRSRGKRMANNDDWPITARYNYTDGVGKVIYQVRRHEPEAGSGKTFRQWTADGIGGFIPCGPKDDAKVLYRLPEVLEASIIFVVEGEKDVETLREHGFVATTNVGGAKQPWLPQYTSALASREVIIIPDNDAPGHAHAVKVARSLFGKVARLIILELERAKDITEWFERGGSELGLIAQLDSEEVSQ